MTDRGNDETGSGRHCQPNVDVKSVKNDHIIDRTPVQSDIYAILPGLILLFRHYRWMDNEQHAGLKYKVIRNIQSNINWSDRYYVTW